MIYDNYKYKFIVIHVGDASCTYKQLPLSKCASNVDGNIATAFCSDVSQGQRGGTVSPHLFYQGNGAPLQKSNMGERRSPWQRLK